MGCDRGVVPGRAGRRGRPFAAVRSIVEGIMYRYWRGIAWRDVPQRSSPGIRSGLGIGGRRLTESGSGARTASGRGRLLRDDRLP